ncbi:MAG TPA: hypothetical protein VM536_20870, partial [Chloroflexia bacterium]|nr:hypothetical protein [Chloroflexia bacterium]
MSAVEPGRDPDVPLVQADQPAPDEMATAPGGDPSGPAAATVATEILEYDLAALQPLPVGALLAGRYVLRGLVQQETGANIYRAQVRGQQRCPTCGAIADRELTACGRCYGTLTGQEPMPAYSVAEATDPET